MEDTTATEMRQPVAVVTGASRGIGQAIALRLARAGYRIALLGRDAGALAETASACEAEAKAQAHSVVPPSAAIQCKQAESESSSPQFLPFVVDLSVRDQVSAAMQSIMAAFDDISVLVCNAGVLLSTPIVDGDPTRWEQELDVNVKGTMAAAHVALPQILKSSAVVKAVIIIGSTGSQWSWPFGAGYCASKHALKGFAGSLFEEVRDKGVKVCIIMPGFTDTAMTASNPGMVNGKKIQPDDVAHAVECVLNFPSSACPTEILIRPQYNCTDGTVPYTIV